MGFNPSQAIEYYQSQLIIQYNGLPKASGTIAALANCSVCDQFYAELQDCFDLTTAVGNQLTIIGNIVGVPRYIYGLDLTDTFFTLSNWNGQPASVGFNAWQTPADTDKIAVWQTTSIYIPTDFEMLALIQLKILANNAYTSLGQIVPDLYSLFGMGITLTDNFDFSIGYNFIAPYVNVGLVAQFLGNIAPIAMGLGVSYNFPNGYVYDDSGNLVLDDSGNPVTD